MSETKIRQIYSGSLRYPAPAQGRTGTCGWTLWQLEDGTYVSLVTESDVNQGMSVTNAAEVIATEVFKQVLATLPQGSNPRVRFFEAYPYYFYGEDARVDEVTFGRSAGLHFASPSWKPMRFKTFKTLVDMQGLAV